MKVYKQTWFAVMIMCLCIAAAISIGFMKAENERRHAVVTVATGQQREETWFEKTPMGQVMTSVTTIIHKVMNKDEEASFAPQVSESENNGKRNGIGVIGWLVIIGIFVWFCKRD